MILLGLLAAHLVAAPGALAQNPLLDVLEASGGASASGDEGDRDGDPLLAIENALAEARQRRSALERARDTLDGENTQPSSALERAARLVRVLEQRREAQIRTNALNLGREAIQSGLARDPSELFGVPPPFPVPILDGVLQSWRREVEQEKRHRTVVEDRRANLRLAEETDQSLDKQRRRLRDKVATERDEVERIRLETDQRTIDDRIEIAGQQVTLAKQRLDNATIEHEIKQIATRQARAALAWVEAHLAPRETDLADAIELLDRNRFELDRELGVARTRLASSEAKLAATEERSSRVGDEEEVEFELELTVRRGQLSRRQSIVALLNQRIERLGRMRTSWQRRYAVLSDRIDLEEAPAWRDSADHELERLTRLRRIHESELAKLRLELASLLRRVTEPNPALPEATRWHRLELEDLEALVSLYQSDLASLDHAIQLEERLRAELLARLKDRDIGERMRGFAAATRAFWSYELSTSQDSPITPGKIVIALSVFLLGYFFSRFMKRALSRRLFPQLGFDRGASNAFASLAFYALLAATFLFALRSVNIPLTAFAVVGGAIALGIGFGSQTLVSNFISGLLLLAERPIQVGDLVEIAGVVGTVETIGLRSTRIRTADNFHIIVPNAAFLETNVVNWTHQDPKIRMKVTVGVAYGSPTREVERLLIEAATGHERSLEHPPPTAYFRDFADSALLFDVRFWIRYDERTDRPGIESDVRFRIDELFAEHGITIAFPQMDVHLDMRGGTAVAPRGANAPVSDGDRPSPGAEPRSTPAGSTNANE
ncbi:MAG: hypothetical protein CL908_11400 [Deltaproteobacteria bacterium]|nr:hypothetical protein [Deltaproteobacteria bacterium]